MATNSYDEVLRIIIKQEGDTELAKLAQAILDAGRAGDVADDQLSGLTDELDRIAKQREAIAAFTRASAGLFELSGKLDDARAKVASLAAAQQAGGTVTAASARELARAEQVVARLEREQARLELAVTRSNVALQRAGIDANNLVQADQNLAGQLGQVRVRLSELGDAAASSGRETGTLAAIAGRVGTAFTGAAGAVFSFGGKLLAITGIAGAVSGALAALNVGRFFGGAISSAAALEAQLSEVRAVVGATTEQMVQMKAAVEAASASTKFTVVEAANALGELARASGDADQAIAQLPATLNLAQAAGIGAAESATLLTTTITQFGLEATDATRIADLFATEANTTNDTVSKLGLAMSYVAPLAKQLGASVEGTTALIGALADQGFRGERAGTALRNVMSQLLDPTSKFSTALRGLGITSTDFNEIIVQLAAAGDKGKQALLALDSEARPAIAALVGSGGAGIAKLTEALKLSAGQAAATADVMGANFDTATTRFTGALDFMRRALVEPILEPLAAQFDGASTRIRAFVASVDFQKLVASIKDFAINGAQAIVEFVSAIDFSAAVQRITDFVNSFRGFVKTITDSASGVGKALSVTANAIGLVFNTFRTVVHAAATAIAGSVSLILRAGAELNSFNFADKLIAKMRGTATAAESMKSAADALMESAKANYEDTGNAAGALAENLKALADAAADTGDKGEQAAPKIALTGKAAEEAAARALHAAEGFDYLTGKGTDLGNELKLIPDYLRPFGLGMDAGAASTTKLGDAAKKAEADAAALTGALADLGIKSQAELTAAATKAAASVETVTAARKAGSAQIEDIIRAVKVWAEAERAASADSSAAVKAVTETKIAAKIAALGLTQQMAQAGAAGQAAGSQISAGMAQAKASVDGLRTSASDAQTTIVAMAENAKTTVGDLVYELNKANTSYASLGEAGKAAFDKVAKSQSSGAGGVTGVIASIANDWSAYFSGISQGAADAFQDVLRSANNSADGTSLAIGRYLGALSDGSVLLKQRIAEQQAAADRLLVGYQEFGASGGAALNIVEQAAAGSAAEVERLLRQLESTRAGLNLLDKGRVDGLNNAIKSVEQRLQSLKDAAAGAKRELAETAASLQDDLDQQDGKLAAVEQRRYQRQVDQINALAKQNDVVNSEEHRKALANAKAIHDRKMADIQAQQDAAEKAAQATVVAQRDAAEAAKAAAAATTQSAAAASADADAAERAATARERGATAAQATAAASGGIQAPPSSSTSTSVTRHEFIIKDDRGTRVFTQSDIDQLMPQIMEAFRRAMAASGARP